MSLTRLVTHVDPSLARAVKDAAAAERRSVSDFLRTTLTLRLEVGGMVEPVRAAIADAGANAALQLRHEVEQGMHQVLAAGQDEREHIRSLIADFITGLQSLGEEVAPQGAPSGTTAAASPARIR